MASIAETLLQGVQRDTGKLGEAIGTGTQQGIQNANKVAELALVKEQNQIKAQKLEQDKKDAELAGDKQIIDYVKFASSFPDIKTRTVAMKNLPAFVDKWGGSGRWSPETIEAMQQSPEIAGKIQTLADRVARKETSYEDATAIKNNLPELMKIPTASPAISKAGKEMLERDARRLEKQEAFDFRKNAADDAKRHTLARDASKEAAKISGQMTEMATVVSAFEQVDKAFERFGGLDNPDMNRLPIGTSKGKIDLGNVSAKSLSLEERLFRQNIQGLVNVLLKSRSGGAVTPAEGSRLLAEIGFTATISPDQSFISSAVYETFKTPEELVQGLKTLREGLRAKLGTVEGLAGEQGLAEYRKRAESRGLVPISSELSYLHPREKKKPGGADPDRVNKPISLPINGGTINMTKEQFGGLNPTQMKQLQKETGLDPEALKLKFGAK